MTNNIFQINTVSYNNILDIELLLNSLDAFIQDLNQKRVSHIHLLLKVDGVEENSQIQVTYSLYNRCPLDIHNLEDINQYKTKLVNYCHTLSDYYRDIFIHQLIFNYIILNEQQYNHHKGYKTKLGEDILNLPHSSLIKKLKHSNLPSSPNSQFQDTIINHHEFKRTLDNKMLFYKDGQVDLLLKTIQNVKFMTTLKPSKKLNDKIMTLDIETYLNNSIHIPYCISTYYFNDSTFKNEFKTFMSPGNKEDLFFKLFDYLFQEQFHNYTIYIHNSSSFDMIFIFKLLLNYNPIQNVKPIIRDGKFINLDIYFKVPNVTKLKKVSFRDSFLLLPASLLSLCKQFNVDSPKGIFPYSFVNQTKISLTYEGIIPEYSYFDRKKVSLEQYLEYSHHFTLNPWNLKNETIKYCEQDVKTLYQIIDKLSKQMK